MPFDALPEVVVEDETLKILNSVYDILKDPSRWCQFDFAKDIKGNSISFLKGEAYSFCLMGAFYSSHRGTTSDSLSTFTFIKSLGFQSQNHVEAFNDNSSHRAVVQRLRTAIEKRRQELALV